MTLKMNDMRMKTLYLILSLFIIIVVTNNNNNLFFVGAEYPGALFPWSSKSTGDCPPGYDFCGVLEFCKGDDTFGYRLPCLEDDQDDCDCPGISGPLIRLQPGNKYKLILRNAVPQTWVSTNIHTHGLHIVGNGDSDDVTRRVSGGGTCLDYTWDIPMDHPGGTFWYHAHRHGSTEEQVGGGAYGMLIVEDNLHLNPNIPEWTTNELLLQGAMTLDGILLGNGKGATSYDDDDDSNDTEVLDIQSNQWYRLRVSMVSTNAVPADLTFTMPSDDSVACEIHKVASDGVWRSEIPGPTGESFEMTGASRADFAVRCNITTTTPTTGNSNNGHFVDLSYGSFFQQHLASLRVFRATASASSQQHSPPIYLMTNWNPIRPPALQDMRDEIVPDSNKFTAHLGYDTVNNVGWDPTTPLAEIAYNEVHEWTLVGTSGHPFHIHLYHVQVISGCGPTHEVGEFYDVISSSETDVPCIVRFRTSDIGQRCVLHCHVMLHEDNGSMAWVNVTDGGSGIMPRNDVESLQYICPATVSMFSPTDAPSNSSPPSDAPTEFPTISVYPSEYPSAMPSVLPSSSPSVGDKSGNTTPSPVLTNSPTTTTGGIVKVIGEVTTNSRSSGATVLSSSSSCIVLVALISYSFLGFS